MLFFMLSNQFRHRMSKTRIYKCWSNMKSRCYNVRDICYLIYGGRGIIVAAEWHDFKTFYNDMYQTYSADLTLDRIDNNKDYQKNNCRWATPKEQGSNRSTNITFKGETATQAGERLGGSRTLVHTRLNQGMSKERAFTQCIEIHKKPQR